MAIHYTCRCGANIRMPRNVAGKKARCNSCGYIFTVPTLDLNPETEGSAAIPLEPPPASASRPTVAEEATGEVGDWLGEFAKQESAAASVPPAGGSDGRTGSAGHPPATLIDFADEEDILAPAPRLPGRRPTTSGGSTQVDEERSGIIGPTRSYWTDLVTSFVFFLDGPSLVTFLVIVLLNMLTAPLAAGGFFGPMGMRLVGIRVLGFTLVTGYLFTFYMAVIRETAAGEDELPNIWIDDVYGDLIFSVFRFAGTWLWVLIPAMVFALVEYVNLGRVDLNIVLLLGAAGLLFWPVVILGVSLGGSFHGMWPHTIVLTALVAPLPYLAMCGVLLVAAAIEVAPYTEWFGDAVSAISTKTNKSLSLVVLLINSGLSAYAAIVAMRAVGLYYRHYKQKFPWVAE